MTQFAKYLDKTGEIWIAREANEERAAWAEEAVLAFRMVCVGDMDETALFDLVANLGHLCDKLSAEFDFDLSFEEMVEKARTHYEGEKGEGDGFG